MLERKWFINTSWGKGFISVLSICSYLSVSIFECTYIMERQFLGLNNRTHHPIGRVRFWWAKGPVLEWWHDNLITNNIMFTIFTDNIFKLWGSSLAKSVLYLLDGTIVSIASPQCIYSKVSILLLHLTIYYYWCNMDCY